MHKIFLRIAAILGALSVILGAFAAHGLKQVLSADQLQVFETAVRYQFYHVFALLAAGILYAAFPGKFMKWAGYLFIAGMILFSGSLYLLCYVKHQGYLILCLIPFAFLLRKSIQKRFPVDLFPYL